VPAQAIRAQFGQIYLFYGCRDDRLDFLYREEIQNALNTGVLTKLVLACSRRPEYGRRYVQDGLREYAADVWKIMSERKGSIFVCGDAIGMARDVNDALIEIIQQQGDAADAKAASEILAMWSQEGRYLRDLVSLSIRNDSMMVNTFLL
jgi:sulfite reductase alpha subunit-like flavoprotein